MARGSDKGSISERSFCTQSGEGTVIVEDRSRESLWGWCCQSQGGDGDLGQGGSGHGKKWKVQEGPRCTLAVELIGSAKTETERHQQ